MTVPDSASLQQTRRSFLQATLGLSALASSGLATTLATGCIGPPSDLSSIRPDLVWGRRGLSDGRLLKPRAMTIDAADQLYLVDTTGRIQVFDADGQFLRGWKTPETEFGRPTGLSITPDQHLLVADTHYFRVLVYTLEGKLLEDQIIGGVAGDGPGEFAFVTDAVRDKEGVTYVGEYGESDRIQRFDPTGKFIDAWGGTGRDAGQFIRPQCLALSDDGKTLWIADACNHRIQVYDVSGKPERIALWGQEGREPGFLYYPYGLVLSEQGTIYVCEYGNQRIQHLTSSGESLGIIGQPGHDDGQFYQPWGLGLDSQGRLHVLDSNNHRVQRFVIT